MYLMQIRENMNTTINALFFENGTASHRWRIDGVADRVNADHTQPHGIYVLNWQRWNDTLPEGTNLVIMEMLSSPKMVEKIHSLGAKVIFEADDALIDTYGKERKNLMQVNEEHRNWTLDTLKLVDAMTVTSETLKENYARFYDGPIYVLPNYMDYQWYGEENFNIERTTDEIRIGWFGSQGHLEDLQMVTPAIGEILIKYPQVKFVYCGFGGMSSDKKITQIGWGEDVFKELPRDRREYYIGVNEEIWAIKHRGLDLDIGICPLINDEFNKNKTPIKWMEFSVLGTPTVCSPTLYEDVVDHNRSGFIANDTSQWVEYLSCLIEDKEKRKSIGDKAKALIKAKYNIDDHYNEWMSVYKEVVLG
jgi:glycosyltransferase involved in cell wall biosynthesis